MNNMNFMQYITDYISGVMSLREPQEKSLKILEDIINDTNLLNNRNIEEVLNVIHSKYPICTDFERKFISLTFALATGVGKTRLMGAFITYLYTNYGIKNFLVVAPGTTVYEKLKADLGNPDNLKYVFKGLGCFNTPPKVITDDDYKNKNTTLFDSDVNIYVYNIGKFDKENAKMKEDNEFLGGSFYKKLAEMKDLVIIMDESHHYRADKGMNALNELNPVLGLELTATPIVNIKSKQVPFKNVVYEYPLSEAIKDGYTRVPFAVTRTDIDFYHFGDEQLDKLMLNDGIKCHERIKNKFEVYSKVNNKTLVKPFMLVVCKDTNHAKKIEEYVKSYEFRNGKYKNKTIKIESKMTEVETEANTKLLLEVERADNPIEIVIHVNMLKEGWDVNNLYTIVPLRTASSKILREQMVGRGLRLPYGKRTGDKEIDSVMLTAHDKFQEILEEAQKGNSIFKLGNVIKAEEVEDEKNTYTQLALDLTQEQDELRKILKEDEEKYTISNSINMIVKDKVTEYIYNNENKMTEENKDIIKKQIEDEIKNDEDLGRIFEENRSPIESWMNKAIEKVEEEVNNRFILIPKIKTEREEGEYYFDDFDLDTSKFNQKPIDNKLLLQNLIDVSEVEIMEGGYINFDAVSPEKTILEELRSKSEIDYEKTAELLHKLITQVTNKFKTEFDSEQVKNIVMMYKKELSNEIYNQMLKHFVRNEGIIKEEVFAERPINYQSNYTYNIKKNLFDNYDSDRDGRITSILFDGIKRGVFDTAKFDSVPELQLSKIVERENDFVERWLRPSPIDFNITYNGGKNYEPDFVIETKDTIYLVEVKGDDKLNDLDVLAKKQKSIEYCKLVSKWAKETGNKKWVHVFIPASKISSKSTFRYLAEYYAVE
ncbi:MAG: DEAD/DEAH box helicase family protein [Clostridia bacterium]|nr:DEAD/DEAH box helicase family protein [Clostridia bacterium]